MKWGALILKSGSNFKQKNGAWILIILGWLVYATSYLGKVNYSANITQIIDFYGVNKTEAGTVPTFFFFAYGIGQVLNGLLCKKYNIKWMIFGSLTISATINLLVGLTSDFFIIKWLWLINGIVLSVLWPTLVRLLSETMPVKLLGTSSVVMGTTVAVGTMVAYGLSSIYAAFDNFKLSFYTASIAIFTVSIVWLLLYNKSVEISKKEQENELDVDKSKINSSVKQNPQKGDKRIFLTSIYILCFYSVGVNLIKDGLITWVPAILKEEFFMKDSLSILLTLFLPVLAIFGNAVALQMHKIIPDYVNHCAIIFVITSVLIGSIIGSLTLKTVVCVIIGLVAVSFLISSLNSLITSVFPLFMRGKVNSGLFAGILNGFAYLGSTISAYGLGVVADNFGWITVFWLLIGFCIISLIFWGVYSVINAFVKKKPNT